MAATSRYDIEGGLFNIQAKQLLQFRQKRQAQQERQQIIDRMYANVVAIDAGAQPDPDEVIREPIDPATANEMSLQSDDVTCAFLRLANLPTCPLDRLSRYEATLWRQACQIIFTLQSLGRRRPWERLRSR